MKFAAQKLPWLIIGVTAAVAVVFGWLQRSSTITASRSSPTTIASRPTLGSAPPVIATDSSQARLSAVDSGLSENTRTLLRLKLKQLSETTTGDNEKQDRLLRELSALLTDANAAEIVLSLSLEELRSTFGLAALERWLDVDTTEATAWIAARSSVSEVETWVVARKLLNRPDLLDAFCGSLPDSEWKQRFLSTAGLEAVARDLTLALKLAQEMKPGEAQTNLLQTATYDWMTRDPAAASSWIIKVPDQKLREQLFATAAKAIAASDPDLAAGWLGAAAASGGVYADTALCVVEAWLVQDPAKAANWVAHFPVGPSRDASVETVARAWLKSDPSSASEWIRRLPEHDRVLAWLKSEQVKSHPADL